MKLHLTCFFFLLSIFLFINGNAQQFFSYPNSSTDKVIQFGLQEQITGNYYFIGSVTADSVIHAFIEKVDQNGSVRKSQIISIDTTTLSYDFRSRWNSGMIHFEKRSDTLILIGNACKLSKSVIYAMALDTAFNLLWEKTFQENSQSLSASWLKKDSSGYLLTGFANQSNCYPFTFRLGENADSVNLKYLGSLPCYPYITMAIPDGNEVKLYGEHIYFGTHTGLYKPGELAVIDTSTVTRTDKETRFNRARDYFTFNDSTLFVYGLVDSSYYNGSIVNADKVYGFLYDAKNDTVIRFYSAGDSAKAEIEAAFGLIYEEDSIFTIGGTSGWDRDDGFFHFGNSYIFLSKIDISSGTKIEKYFGGDYYYNLWGINKCPDGGYLLMGSIFDWQNFQGYQRDPFFIKVDSADLVLGNVKSTSEAEACVVYPNPGKDQLNVLLPQPVSGKLSLFNANGDLVREEEFHGKTISISTQTLPAGFYFFRITADENRKYSGKWLRMK